MYFYSKRAVGFSLVSIFCMGMAEPATPELRPCLSLYLSQTIFIKNWMRKDFLPPPSMFRCQ